MDLSESSAGSCSASEILDRVGSKWSIAILLAVHSGPVRFSVLERNIPGISRRMLTLTLRNLERDGLVVRTLFPTVPPRVEYSLTPMAAELHPALVVISGWAERHRGEIAEAREAYDRRCS